LPETLKTTLREAELIRDGAEWAIGRTGTAAHERANPGKPGDAKPRAYAARRYGSRAAD